MAPDVFALLVRKGLGRAVLHLQEHDAAPYRDEIIHACTHDLRYDRQCEDGRAAYLYNLIRATGDPAPYRDAILSTIPHPADDAAEWQMLELCLLFAQEGDSEPREALYAAFERHAALDDSSGAEEIVRLDGVEGLVHVVRRLPETGWDDEDDDPEGWVTALEERDGAEKAWAALESAAEDEPGIARALASVRRKREEWRQKREQVRKPEPPMPWEALQDLLAAPQRSRAPFWRWGRLAAEEDIRRAAEEFRTETDPGRVLGYLRVFERRRFPLDPVCLLDLARSHDEHTAWAALRALEHTPGPAVRDLALSLLDVPERRDRAVALLVSNYAEGDHALVGRMMEQPAGDEDALHALGSAVLNFCEAHPDPACARPLLLLYERGPCSMCRNYAVDHLLEMNALPETLCDECRWDADPDTRAAVAGEPDKE